jgi:hypothetical protein
MKHTGTMNRPRICTARFLAMVFCGLSCSAAFCADNAAGMVRASDFGLAPGRADNTEAFRAALAACKGRPNPTLVLEPGVYRFDTSRFGESRGLCEIKDAENLTIKGNGAVFLIATTAARASLFKFSHSRNIAISGINIDCEFLPFAQGRIVSFDGGAAFVIQIDPGFPLHPDLPIASVNDCDPETGAILANIDIRASAFESVTRTGEGRVVIKLDRGVLARAARPAADFGELKTLLTGAPVIIRQKMYDGYAFTFANCAGVTLADVTIHSYPGIGVHCQESRDLFFQRLRIAPPEKSGRLMSTTKDALHLTHVSGSVRLEDSVLAGIGDDGINVYSKFRNVQKITGPAGLEMIFDRERGWPGPVPRKGDVLRFWDALTLDEKHAAGVESAAWDAARKVFTVKLNPGPDVSALRKGDWISNDKYLPKVVVRRCHFESLLGRAAVFSTSDVIMEDCKVAATAYAGVLLPAGGRHERQGPAARNVIIRRNTFERTGAAAVYGYVFVKNPGTTAQSGVTIEDNVICDNRAGGRRHIKTRHPDWLHWSAAICMTDASGIRIARNTFNGYRMPIYVGNADGVDIRDNRTGPDAEVGLYAARNARTVLDDRTTLRHFPKRPDSDLNYMILAH